MKIKIKSLRAIAQSSSPAAAEQHPQEVSMAGVMGWGMGNGECEWDDVGNFYAHFCMVNADRHVAYYV